MRLLAEVFTADGRFLTSSCSEVITNSKSKAFGPLQLHDVNPTASCCGGETKIFVLSFFKLAADVGAIFVLYDPDKGQVVYDRHDLMRRISQPEASKVFNGCCLIFTAPKQNYEVSGTAAITSTAIRLSVFIRSMLFNGVCS